MRSLAIVAFFALASSVLSPARGAELELRKGDRICLVGNALGERMQHHNYWETLLHQRFPEHELVVRNLCFPGDEPYERLRSLNFGSPDDHLKHSGATVILYFFGLNESFRGPEGLDEFAAELKRLVDETKRKDYSGQGPPRIALISPIAVENTGDPHLPDGTEHNERLAAYTEAMRKVADETGVAFAELFAPTKDLFEQTEQNLTINSIHLSDEGYRALAPILDEALFGKVGVPASAGSGQPEGWTPTRFSERLQAEIADKNFHWWHRYRAVNGYSIYGTRGEAGTDGSGQYRNREVMERERAILDQMTANRDARIWKIAQGKDVPEQVDDSNTLPFLEPSTNVGGTDDPNRKAGKLGSLEYIPAAEQVKHFKLAPGYEINLVASEEDFPELANSVALNFDSKGRLWVSTMPSYPQWKPKTELDDKLLILQDRNGDGRADDCKVFAGGLHQPTGFELGDGGVYVAQQPDILYLKDTDGDDRADVRIRQLVGFDTADSHHGLAAFEWGPDGALYFQEGTFKQSQLETPYGPVRLGDAGVWRYEPRTEKLEVHVSFAMANPWGHVFDRWGQNFLADASPGFNYWATPISGRIEYPDKHPGASRDRHLDWGGSRSDKSFPTFIKKRIRPTSGCEFVSSRHFPPEAQGNFLFNNVIGDLGVLQHTVREEGSGFVGEEITPLLLCEHGNFRPVDLQFGPDGALYIVDWHNALIGHLQHNLRDPSRDHSHGRIWRVTYKDRPLLTLPQIDGAPIASLLELLKEPEDRTRYRVRRELGQRPTADVIAALEQWVAALDPADEQHEHNLLEALWVYQTHHAVNEDLLSRMLESPDHRARAAATRVLCEWRDRVASPLELLRARINDSHPRVRLEAVRACSFIISPQSMELALEVLNHEMDYYLEYTLDETLRALEHSLSGDPPQMAHAHHGHHGPHADQPAVPQTLVFLNKSPKVVRYQLERLSAPQLLATHRSPDDPQYKPIYAAILRRSGVSRQDREEALAALSALNRSTPVTELLAAIDGLDASAPQQRSAIDQLSGILLRQPKNVLAEHRDAFARGTKSENEPVRAAAYAGLIAGGDPQTAWGLASASEQGRRDFLAGLPLVPAKDSRAALRKQVVESLSSDQPIAVRQAALSALASVPAQPQENFRLAAQHLDSPQLRSTAVQTLLQIPKDQRPADAAQQVVKALVELAEATPAAKRTTPDFLDAMHLADELLAALPAEAARSYRDRLREVVVRVVRIETVNEEMRYDTPYFAVEAGRPVQLVLRNDDLMPHNLVVTAPGKLRDVAQQAATMSPQVDARGWQYVPESPDVLFATRMVESHSQDVLTFTAPTAPGEYPYVCTFPNHWMRMYGVMLVVDNLEEWLADPREPADPLGITRQFVRNWTMDDFPGDLAAAVHGRDGALGRRIFEEATCLQCHKAAGQGGAVGPDLSDVFERRKGDRQYILREILDPSHTVEPKYTLYNVLLTDGRVISGIITEQDRETITVVSNPEKPQPQTIDREDVEELIKSSTSLMPKGLLDRFTQEEILALLAFLESGASSGHEDHGTSGGH